MERGKDANQSSGPGPLCQDVFLRLRALTHDLSNSLEVIVQAAYLLEQSDLEGNSRRWIQMIDHATQEAAGVNQKIRDLLGDPTSLETEREGSPADTPQSKAQAAAGGPGPETADLSSKGRC